MDNPYEVLGVRDDVPLQSIKRIYQELRGILHPDRESGDAEKFDQVQQAWELISDPEALERWRRTGSAGAPATATTRAEHHLRMLFKGIADQTSWAKGSYVQTMRQAIQRDMASGRGLVADSRTDLRELPKMPPKFSGAEEDDLFAGVVRQRVDFIDSEIAACEQKLEMLEAALVLLDAYSDPATARFNLSATSTTSTT